MAVVNANSIYSETSCEKPPDENTSLLPHENSETTNALEPDEEVDTSLTDSDTETSDSNTTANSQQLTQNIQQAAFDKHIHDQGNRNEHIPGEQSFKEITDGTIAENDTTRRIIDKVRDYQQELFERAKQENIIAVLDTGSGKTLIACLLIRHVLDQEQINRAAGKPSRLVFFLANSVHLVLQQARVLANNLTEEPVVLHGASTSDPWKKSTWENIMEHNKVVVCTPATLDQSLMRSLLNMEDISLLIFDEAHHAKKDHPYSRLIRSYYLKCVHEKRPKIFGMTASAVDSKGDIAKTAQALEALLHAKIATTDDTSLLSFAPKPTDVKWCYPRPRPHFDTDLHQSLSAKVRFCQDLKRGFEFSTKATTELGFWCADMVWKFVMSNSTQTSSSIRRKFEQSTAYAALVTVEEKEQALYALDEASLRVQSHVDRVEKPTPACLSSKVSMLYEKLKEHFEANPDTRAIVFVEERLKALVLNECFRLLKIPNMRTGVLLGIAGNTFEATSVKQQEKMLEYFRTGLINLVFATSVADEGLDIPQCNLCVRFDPCTTTIQYMQSRGRARMKGSIFAHMIEEDNHDQTSDVDYYIANEQYIKSWCQSLPYDRRLGHGTELAKLLSKDAASKSFQTAAGAICDNSNALLILARFAASLYHTGATDKETYEEEIDLERNWFRYAVRIPPNTVCKVRGCRGDWKSSKQLAKRSAAWACCYLLRKHGLLSDNLDSIYRKTKPENANAHVAVTAKLSAYEMQIKPSAWQIGLDTLPYKLHATIIRFHPKGSLRHELAPIVVLTRSPLPIMPSYSSYLEDNIETIVSSQLVSTELQISEKELLQLTKFTLQGVFSDVFNKVYDIEPEKMSYWLAPMATDKTDCAQEVEHIVDMKAVTTAEADRICWQPGMSPEIWANRFVCDPFNGKFHYFLGDVIPEARMTDPVPESVPLIPQKKRANIMDFSSSLWTAAKKRAQSGAEQDFDQPVFAADLVGTRRNFLEQTLAKELTSAKKNLIPCLVAPQPLQVARIAPQFAASCLVWPAIINRIESYLIALEAFDKLGLSGISADLALEAFTKDGDNEDGEQTHKSGNRGLGKNYERLEFIGDSLLKMTTTMTIFNRTTCDEEGMHCRRMEMLCNRNLYNTAASDDLQLFKYARTRGFKRSTWYPEFLKLLQGRGANKDPVRFTHPPMTQDLGMKSIADIAEAIIGAAVTSRYHVSHGNNRFDLGIKAITKLVRSEDHAVHSWSDIVALYQPASWALREDDPIAVDRARLIATRTGYTFKHPRILRSAFTHSSDTNSSVPNLQRLEFLGDAVFDWVCISWLFFSNPNRNPQWLTEHKMAMVSNKFLAALAITLDFDKFIFVTTAKLAGDIEIYATKVREALAQPQCPKSFWTEIEAPPKALSDLVESYLGAVLVDSSFEFAEMERFFEKHVKHFFEDISAYDTFANRQPTTHLHHKLTQEYKCRKFLIDVRELQMNKGDVEVQVLAAVIIHEEIVASSKGTGARYAKVRASKEALTKLEGISVDEFRRKYSCDCGEFETE